MSASTGLGSVVAQLSPTRLGEPESKAERRACARTVLRLAGPVLVVGVLGAVSLLSWDRWQLGALLLLVQCLPLAARERFPIPVLVLTAAGTMTQVAVGLPPSNAFLGQAVALTTVVRRMAWPRSLVIPLLLLGVNLAALWAAEVSEIGRLLLIYAVTFGGAWALGDAGARRAIVNRSVEREIAS
mgnify:CR=1 FL=1